MNIQSKKNEREERKKTRGLTQNEMENIFGSEKER
jgi:hypothetical protein